MQEVCGLSWGYGRDLHGGAEVDAKWLRPGAAVAVEVSGGRRLR